MKDNSIVDVFWGIGFLILCIVLLFVNKIFGLAQILTMILVVLWSMRLSISILQKKLPSAKEDFRYAAWRKTWKFFYIRSFFQIYLLQMVLLLLIATPFFVIFSGNGGTIVYSIIGAVTAVLGLGYETIADDQIKRYITGDSKIPNTIYTGGLWKYSRHPNYLGESVFWLGISIISLQFSIFGLAGFTLITLLLVFVSGIPMKEERYKTKNNYPEYSKNTPLFIPNFLKK